MARSKKSIKTFLSGPETAKSTSSLGRGSYAEVFDSDGFMPGTVVKTYSEKTAEGRYGGYLKDGTFIDAWLIWALYCMGSKHRSFMPKVFALHIDWEKGTYHAIMEKLHPVQKHVYLCTELSRIEAQVKYKDEMYGIRRENFISVFKEIEAMLPDFFYFDGHSDNWMERRDFQKSTSIVATDPLHISNAEKSKPEKMKKFNQLIWSMANKLPNVMMVGQPNLSVYDKEIERIKKEREEELAW